MSRCGKSDVASPVNPVYYWGRALTANLETGYKSRILTDLIAFRPFPDGEVRHGGEVFDAKS